MEPAEKPLSGPIANLVNDYKKNAPNTVESYARKFGHFVTGGFVKLNPQLNKTIAALFSECSQKKTIVDIDKTEMAALIELTDLAQSQGAGKDHKIALHEIVHNAGARMASSITEDDIHARVSSHGYFVVNNPHDPVSFSLGTFSYYPVTIENDEEMAGKPPITYCCAETAFQASKFKNYETRQQFANLSGAEAQNMADRLIAEKIPAVDNWGQKNYEIMKNILKCRLNQNETLQHLLLASKDTFLVVHSPNSFWGDGQGKGQNALGKMMMEQRGNLMGGIGITSPPRSYFENFNIPKELAKFKVCTYNLGAGLPDFKQLIPELWTKQGANELNPQQNNALEVERKALQEKVAERLFNENTADVFCFQEVLSENKFLLEKIESKGFEVVAPIMFVKSNEKFKSPDSVIAINKKRFANIQVHPCRMYDEQGNKLNQCHDFPIATATDIITGKKVAFISGHISGFALDNVQELKPKEFKDKQSSAAASGNKQIQDILKNIEEHCQGCDLKIIGADFNTSKKTFPARFKPLMKAGFNISFPGRPTNITSNPAVASPSTKNRELDGFAFASEQRFFVQHIPSPIVLDRKSSPSDHAPEIVEVSYSVHKSALQKFGERLGL